MARKYDEEAVISQVGGRFKLATLLEKRYRELLFGGRPLVEVESNDPLDTLLEEIIEGKVELIPESEAVAAAAAVLMSDVSNEATEEQAVRAALEAGREPQAQGEPEEADTGSEGKEDEDEDDEDDQ